jgi:putative ABC transport system substrate-binding protein
LAQGDRVRRVGVLAGPNDENDSVLKSVFTQALADLGWTDGRNVRRDLRWAGGDINRIGALARELVGLQPDIILTLGATATVAVQRETRTIPIVFATSGDPVASGIVARLDRPGGNITGFAGLEPLLGGKWLELLQRRNPFACAFGTTGTLFVIVLESGPREFFPFLTSENKYRWMCMDCCG